MINYSTKVDIKKISLYLAGKLPPYYWGSNPYKFSKAIRKFSKHFSNKELETVRNLAQDNDYKYYFMILDVLWDNTSNDPNSKEDFLIMLHNIWVPFDVLGLYVSENLKKFKKTLKKL